MTDREKKGNEEAFHTLYDSYVDDAMQTAYAIRKSNRVAADIVQETFIKVYRNIESFVLKKPFKPWFYRILINESRRFFKRRDDFAWTVMSIRNTKVVRNVKKFYL
ncbi:RNA polymerase sigma factor [Oceanobacillus sp. FSL H7-0719]|uniref:RNA polymerase sigma factor n=1 Tax=Oceanobacillus sp. FSL H7-0719 TaxID=2954507 RepID=UPI00324ED3AD